MQKLIEVDWASLFVPTHSLVELVIRGTITYWFCFLYMRFFRRGSGQLSVSDVLLITLIADAAQNSMAGEYKSITEGAILVATLVCWDILLNFLGFKSIVFRKLTMAAPILLVQDGKPQIENLKSQYIDKEELMSMLRQNGIDDITQVKSCFLEGGGNISVIQK